MLVLTIVDDPSSTSAVGLLIDKQFHIVPTPTFPPAYRSEVQHFDPHLRLRAFSFAYWLLVLVYLALWLPILGFWQRRRSRLLKLHTTPPP
jgi:hypothetical protein